MEQFNINDILSKIDDHLSEDKFDQIKDIVEDLHAADISDVLNHFSKSSDRLKIFHQVPRDKWGDVLVEAEDPITEEILEELHIPEISEIINNLDSDEAADILAEVEDEKVEEVLEKVDEESKEEVLELMNYPENSAGGIMGKEYISVIETQDVNAVIDAIREVKDEIDEFYNVFVTDSRNHLLGRIRLRDLVLAKPQMTAADIMLEEHYFVDAQVDQEDVARIFEKYDLVEIPVVDARHQLVGHIMIDDIIDVIEDEASEDISKLSGTGSEEIKEHSPLKIVRARIPWLIVALFAGLGSAFIMSAYDEMLKSFVTLAFFVPVVIAMGGNVGVQSSSIVIRGLATGEINMFDLGHRLFKELIVAIYNSLITSVILFSIIYFGFGLFNLAIICCISMIIAMLVAAIVGATIPFLLDRLNIDPAISSGPFVTTSNDIIGTLIYFLVAQMLLNI